MIENVLIIDTETTGIDPNKGALLIEIGALLYNIKYKKVIQSLSSFFPCLENPVENINHIDPLWTQTGYDHDAPLMFLRQMSRRADFIVAHNAQFDKRFMGLVYESNDDFWKTKWICTKADFKWPVSLIRKRLEDICQGMGVTYTNAHRALNDCQFIADCFSRVDDLDRRIHWATAGSYSNNFR